MPSPKKPAQKPLPTFKKFLPWLLLVGGIIGIFCAFIISYDEFQLLKNPNFIPSCNLNPIIACGSVMQSAQAHLFGFPNPFIGLAAFGIVAATGACLLAGATLKRWYWLSLNAGAFLGTIFVHWLFFESVWRIHALCPYCMAVWIVTIATFWYVTLYNWRAGHLRLLKQLKKIADWKTRHHLDILILWLLIIAGLILKHFWYYYGHYFK